MINTVRERREASGANVYMGTSGRKTIKFGVTSTWRNSIPYYVRPPTPYPYPHPQQPGGLNSRSRRQRQPAPACIRRTLLVP